MMKAKIPLIGCGIVIVLLAICGYGLYRAFQEFGQAIITQAITTAMEDPEWLRQNEKQIHEVLWKLLPRIPPKEPAEALTTFQVRDGFRMDLLAAEPLVTSPVAMEYDENGRAFIVEMRDYPYTDKTTDKPFTERTTDAPLGRIRILEDTDGDGVFDRSTIFAEGLSWPTGLAFWKGGVFVAATPDIWYLKDTDGDGKADVRLKVFTGFRKFNVQAVMNNLKWGLDHRIYGAGATNSGQIRRDADATVKPITLGSRDFCFDPNTEDFELLSGGARFGNCFDDWGNRFICNIRNPVQHVVLPSRYLARNPFLAVRSALHDVAQAGDTLPVYRTSPAEPWRVINALRLTRDMTRVSPRSEMVAVGYVTSASGVTVYRGAAYPPEYHGNVFLGEVAGNLILRQILKREGVTFTASRAEEKVEFLTSTDNWFRPVNYVNAPDGTLHVLDMYRETIEHPWSIPDDIKAHLDLESGRDRGRIYRLTPPGFKVPPPPRLGQASTAELVAALANPNSWWRETAQRLLYERQDQAAVPLLRKLLREGEEPRSLDRLHALWTLAGLKALEETDLLVALGDKSAGLREHAVRLAEGRLTGSAKLLETVLARAEDPDSRVRFQTAFTLGAVRDPRAVPALGRVVQRDGGDPWLRTAILSSAAETAASLLMFLADDPGFARHPERARLFRELALLVGARNRPAELDSVLNAAAQARADRSALVLGLGDGLRRAGKSLAQLMKADSAGAKLIAEGLRDAEQVARDTAASVEERQQAIQLLGHAEFATVRATLTALREPKQPQPIQIAVVRTLAGLRSKDIPTLLLGGYRGCTPTVRSEVVEALAGRKEWLVPLLDAVEAKTVAVTDIPLSRRNALQKHADATIRERAIALFRHDAPGPRQPVVEQYRAALVLPADAARGQKVFLRECATCHRLGDQGHEVGPNLATILHRTPEDVLLHILDPNREVSPNYVEYVVALTDGRVVRGIIAAETPASLTLRRAEGASDTIVRQNIEEMASTGLSLMPEGLEKNLPPQDMADLLRFLLEKK